MVIAAAAKKAAGGKLKDFKAHLDAKGELPEIKELREEVEVFASSFPTLGFEKSTMRYKN